MHNPDHDAPPFHPLPPLVVALSLAVLAIEAVFQLGARGLIGGPEAVGWRVEAVRSYGFFDPLWEHMLTTGFIGQGALWRPVTYVFLHWSAVDAIFAAVLLLAIGNRISREFGPLALAAVFVLSSATGAVMFGLLREGSEPLIGAWPAVYGFLGLLSWTLWIASRRTGRNPWAAFQLVGMLVGLQLFFWLAFGGQLNIASDLGGFVVAFAVAPVLLPGGISRVRALIRAR